MKPHTFIFAAKSAAQVTGRAIMSASIAPHYKAGNHCKPANLSTSTHSSGEASRVGRPKQP